MDQESEAIRQQMEQTRASLSEKLGTLEQEVVGTVHQATSAVTETVENVKDAVQETVDTVKGSVSDTVETVKETLNLPRQVERHPWAMFGGSVAVGFLGGVLLGRSRAAWTGGGWGGTRAAYAGRTSFREAAPAAAAGPGWLGTLGEKLAPEIGKLKGLAIGAALALVRDAVTHSMHPELGTQVREVIDSLTVKLGAQPIHGSLLGEGSPFAAHRPESPGEHFASPERPADRARL